MASGGSVAAVRAAQQVRQRPLPFSRILAHLPRQYADVRARALCRLPHSSVIVAEIRGSDGSLLDSEDCITDAVDDMEELVGVLERLSASSSASHAPPALGSIRSLRDDAAAAYPSHRSTEGGGGGGGGGGHHIDMYGGVASDAVAHGRGRIDEDGMLSASNAMSAGDEHLDLWASDKLRTVYPPNGSNPFNVNHCLSPKAHTPCPKLHTYPIAHTPCSMPHT